MADNVETLVAEIAAEVQRISGLTADQLGYEYGGLKRETRTAIPAFVWHENDEFTLEHDAARAALSQSTHEQLLQFTVIIWRKTTEDCRALLANLNIAGRTVCYGPNFRIVSGVWNTEQTPELAKRGAQLAVTVALRVPLPSVPQAVDTSTPVLDYVEVELTDVDGDVDI